MYNSYAIFENGGRHFYNLENGMLTSKSYDDNPIPSMKVSDLIATHSLRKIPEVMDGKRLSTQ